ncbi:hypothetical protein C7974DRAFT_469547 [Boeremia exigua]|uniref:uncharacterized protein n=1 Tax=Boeremia exigua TaxID=749465 RepID=UPI001E8CCB0F|nr:uncharacterized protein C7974DRAFT_469547 [Boeremia exigua]KAH6638901.1 hypothetical protein C7974DRAFT_469547 [Boeremia exigua]
MNVHIDDGPQHDHKRASFVSTNERWRQRTQQETSLLGLINPLLATSLVDTQDQKALPVEQNVPDEEKEEEFNDDDVDLATDSEEGELDIPKPPPKALTAAQKKKQERKERVLSKDRGPILHTFSPSDIQPNESTGSKTEVSWDEDPEILCCYNWSSTVDGSNTIFVPGAPSRWTPQAIPYIVPGDKGFHSTDYNYVRQPRDPFSAVFHAMTVMNPEYAFNDVDVLADRNNLRVLLEFVQGKTVGPFRLDLYLVLNTLVIVRREDKFWRRSNGTGYGFNFEKHFTTPAPDMPDATSHYRAIRYRMGSLSVVCRFEADACIDPIPDTPLDPNVAGVTPPVPTGPDLMQRPRFTYNAPFRVLQEGNLVPSNQILELKTQVEKPNESLSFGSWQDQLWFGRTKHLVVGRYEAGTGKILYIKQDDATERAKRWEERNQTDLQKLVALLASLRGMLMKQRGPTRAAILVREDPRGPATLHEMLDKRNLMRGQFFERFWMRHARTRTNLRSESRGGAGQPSARGRGGRPGGRGRGQDDGQRGWNAQRGQTNGEAHQPHGLLRHHHSTGYFNAGTHPDPRLEAPRTWSRGGGGYRGRGNASRRGRGGAEQSGS